MTRYDLAHLSDGTLLRDLHALVARDRATTAELLAHLAEVDERRLYARAGYPSMYAWCVGELGLCEQAALKRIHAARVARRFPAIFPAVADGRLHLSAVTLLGPHLTEQAAGDLLSAAAHLPRRCSSTGFVPGASPGRSTGRSTRSSARARSEDSRRLRGRTARSAPPIPDTSRPMCGASSGNATKASARS